MGMSGTGKMKENKRFYGFTDFRGKLAGRGRDSRATANQVTGYRRTKSTVLETTVHAHVGRVVVRQVAVFRSPWDDVYLA